MNSGYGRFAMNSAKYKDHLVNPPEPPMPQYSKTVVKDEMEKLLEVRMDGVSLAKIAMSPCGNVRLEARGKDLSMLLQPLLLLALRNRSCGGQSVYQYKLILLFFVNRKIT